MKKWQPHVRVFHSTVLEIRPISEAPGWRIAIYALSGPHISMLGFYYVKPLPSTMFQVSSYHTIFSHLFKAEIKLPRVDQIGHFCY